MSNSEHRHGVIVNEAIRIIARAGPATTIAESDCKRPRGTTGDLVSSRRTGLSMELTTRAKPKDDYFQHAGGFTWMRLTDIGIHVL